MTDYHRIYAHRADEYDELVRAEDCEGNLIPSIDRIYPTRDANVLEVGVGTGRIAGALVGSARRLVAVDRHAAMLAVASRNLAKHSVRGEWSLLRADARWLPVASGWADVAIAGWVFGHFREWMPANWDEQIAGAINEMRRALRPGGALIIVETLGTGRYQPEPPSPDLADYFGWLEDVQGLSHEAIRTDYQFTDVETAARRTEFFFGQEFAELVRLNQWARVPECTGLWWTYV